VPALFATQGVAQRLALLATRIDGESPFRGYRITCFTDAEEAAVGMAARGQWLLEDELEEKIGSPERN
jgi:hypothetical protein